MVTKQRRANNMSSRTKHTLYRSLKSRCMHCLPSYRIVWACLKRRNYQTWKLNSVAKLSSHYNHRFTLTLGKISAILRLSWVRGDSIETKLYQKCSWEMLDKSSMTHSTQSSNLTWMSCDERPLATNSETMKPFKQMSVIVWTKSLILLSKNWLRALTSI